MFYWFDQCDGFMASALALREEVRVVEDFLATRRNVRGYCACCRRIVSMRVKTGASFGATPNLREGMACKRCKQSNRSRLMFAAIDPVLRDRCDAPSALLEARSPLYKQLVARYSTLTGSEYLDDSHVGGRSYRYRRGVVRHESILGLSYSDDSLALIAHSDVLEHVYDYRAALAECARVLQPGGQLIFTMPFFMFLNDHMLRGRPLPSGDIEHFHPPEYHGDGVHKQGIYTFRYFGWPILDDLRLAGFRSAHIGLNYDPFSGYVSNHHPQFEVGLMLPVVFRAIK